MKQIYLVTAHKASIDRRNPHNYIVGAYETEERASQESEAHCKYRGGKYDCVIDRVDIDQSHEDNQSARLVKWHLGRRV